MIEYQRHSLHILKKHVEGSRKFLQVVAGPRQVGKTMMMRQLLEQIDTHAHVVSTDETIAASPEWLDNAWQDARDLMKERGEKEMLLVVDEIQKVKNWSDVVKKNWDKDSWNKLNLKVIVLGSSRLLLMKGLKESLTGRYFLHYVGHWSYCEMHEAFGLTSEQFAWFGGYPGAASLIKNEQTFKEYLRNAIIEPSISKDILMLTQINKPALLRQLFELGTSYSSQILSYNKIMGQFAEAGNASTLANYTNLLGEALLLTGLDEYSARPIKIKASSPKFQTCNMALLSSLSTKTFAEARKDATYWGRVTESVVGTHLLNAVHKNSLLKLYYWRENGLEVDYVLQYGEQILGIEVKSRAREPNFEALAVFKKRFPHAETIVLGDEGRTWQDFIGSDDLTKLF
jgi:predicted AAA+ superfamily ATPase